MSPTTAILIIFELLNSNAGIPTEEYDLAEVVSLSIVDAEASSISTAVEIE
jgi:hypothetical protein